MNASLAPLIRKTGIAHGIVLGVVSLVLFSAFVFLKINCLGDWVFMPLCILAFISIITFTNAAFIFLAHSYFKKRNDGTMTFGQGVTISFWMGLTSGALFSVIAIFLVVLEEASVNMREIFELRKMLFPFIVIFVSIIIFAVIVGLAVSLIAKKDPPATF